MAKKSNSLFSIFIDGVGLYFSNINKFIKYMSFPVLGQVIGFALIFLASIYYANNTAIIVQKFNIQDINIIIIGAFLITLPFTIIVLKALWEYLVAYGAINSTLENLIKSKKIYDFDSHKELITRRSISYIGLWLIIGLLSLVGSIPLLYIPVGVIFIYCVLVFQVFTFENESTPIRCIKRSFELIKGHFGSTFILICLVGGLTYIVIPQIICKVFEIVNITGFFVNIVSPILSNLPINDWNGLITNYNAALKQVSSTQLPLIQVEYIAKIIINATISTILIMYTLPLRSLAFGLWYKELNGGKLFTNNIPPVKGEKTEKPSEKLMRVSHKKYETKKLDKNILKRAMEKDEE